MRPVSPKKKCLKGNFFVLDCKNSLFFSYKLIIILLLLLLLSNRKHLEYESKLIETILHIPRGQQNITNNNSSSDPANNNTNNTLNSTNQNGMNGFGNPSASGASNNNNGNSSGGGGGGSGGGNESPQVQSNVPETSTSQQANQDSKNETTKLR